MSTQQESQLESELERVRAAIIKHRDQHGDDRCWLDDQELYAALGDGITGDNTMPPREKFLSNCARFYDNRCQAGDWPSCQELEQELEAITAALDKVGPYVPHMVDMKILLPAERVERLVELVMRLQAAVKMIEEAAKKNLAEMPHFPCRIDEMTEREAAIARVAEFAVGALKLIEEAADGSFFTRFAEQLEANARAERERHDAQLSLVAEAVKANLESALGTLRTIVCESTEGPIRAIASHRVNVIEGRAKEMVTGRVRGAEHETQAGAAVDEREA